RLVDVEIVAFVAVVHEEPIFPRAVGCRQVRSAVHLECRVELCELVGISLFPAGRLPAWIVERDAGDTVSLIVWPLYAALGEKIRVEVGIPCLVYHPEVTALVAD